MCFSLTIDIYECAFNGEERSVLELKWFFLLSLFNWMIDMSGLSIPSLLDFVDLCYFAYFLVFPK